MAVWESALVSDIEFGDREMERMLIDAGANAQLQNRPRQAGRRVAGAGLSALLPQGYECKCNVNTGQRAAERPGHREIDEPHLNETAA